MTVTAGATTAPAAGPILLAPALDHPIWLIRHAETSWTGKRWCGRADPPLTAAGRRAAGELGVTLAAELPPGAVVLASPARRARATADAIVDAARSELDLLVVDDLVEVDVGRAEGLTWTELSDREPELAATLIEGRPIDWPDGESAGALAERAERVASRIRVIGAAAPVAVVSHGALLHALAIALVGSRETGDGLEPLAPCGVRRLVP